MKEIWKDIENYDGLYQVSTFGRVKSSYTNSILKGCKTSNGYLKVNLYKNGSKSTKTIHRLVSQAFISNPENKSDVNHIDENKKNNNIDNLEWSTAKENNNHETRNERAAKAISKTKSIPIIATNIKTGESTAFNSSKECARQLDLHKGNISHVLTGRLKQTGGYTFKYKGETK